MARIEFTVEELVTENQQLFVCGRCCECDIHLGDEFSVLVWTSLREHPQLGYETISAETVCQVRLIVEAISCYQHYINFLSPGLSAALRLFGEGMEQLQKLDFQNRQKTGYWLLRGGEPS